MNAKKRIDEERLMMLNEIARHTIRLKKSRAEIGICPLVQKMSEDAADEFLEMMKYYDKSDMMQILNFVNVMYRFDDSKKALVALMFLFYSDNMPLFEELKVLDNCAEEDPEVYDDFTSEFLDNEQISDLLLAELFDDAESNQSEMEE